MVHIVSILNLTQYETEVNRQQINIILKELTKSNEDIRALLNITNQLATQIQVQNIVLHLRAILANLRDCLHFMKQLANHILEYLGVTYDRTKAMDIPEEQFKLCKGVNGQFCPLLTPLQPLTNLPSCIAALYTKNSKEIDCLCELTTKAQPELYLPIPLAPNVWAIISSPFKQQPPVTVICPTKPATSIPKSPPIHVLKLEPACSATSQHFHLPPK